MKLFILESLTHLDYIKKNRNILLNSLVISTKPQISYFLQKEKIKYYEFNYFINEKKLIKFNKKNHLQLNKIINFYDKKLLKDYFFKKNKWFFNQDVYFLYKRLFDQIFFYSYALSKIFTKYNIQEIFVKKPNLEFKNFALDEDISIIFFLIRFNKKFKKFNYIYFKETYENNLVEKIIIFKDFFLKIYQSSVIHLKYKIKQILIKSYFFFNFKCSEVLGFNCDEIYFYNKSNRDKNILLKNLFINDKIYLSSGKTSHVEINKELKKKPEPFFYVNNTRVNFFFQALNFIILNNRKIIKEQIYFYNNIIKKRKLIIFNTLSPFNLINPIIKKLCLINQVPFAVWSHGGWGLTKSLGGYAYTDLKDCNNIFVYGEGPKKCFDVQRKFMSVLENKKINFYKMGSFKLDFMHKYIS
jgi:hypothetical protein